MTLKSRLPEILVLSVAVIRDLKARGSKRLAGVEEVEAAKESVNIRVYGSRRKRPYLSDMASYDSRNHLPLPVDDRQASHWNTR